MEENRIYDKIDELSNYLAELEEILPSDFEEYLENNEKKAACERYFERIIECLIDLANFFAKFKELSIPSDESKIFEVFFENRIINEDLCNRLKNAKGMRNILAHQYGNIDDEIVFEAITGEIIKDAFDFIECIKENIEERL